MCFAPTAIVLMKFRVAITRYLDVSFIFLDCYSTVELANFQIHQVKFPQQTGIEND